jgi:hypothetical protein
MSVRPALQQCLLWKQQVAQFYTVYKRLALLIRAEQCTAWLALAGTDERAAWAAPQRAVAAAGGGHPCHVGWQQPHHTGQ